jgi:hypothetical protein
LIAHPLTPSASVAAEMSDVLARRLAEQA